MEVRRSIVESPRRARIGELRHRSAVLGSCPSPSSFLSFYPRVYTPDTPSRTGQPPTKPSHGAATTHYWFAWERRKEPSGVESSRGVEGSRGRATLLGELGWSRDGAPGWVTRQGLGENIQRPRPWSTTHTLPLLLQLAHAMSEITFSDINFYRALSYVSFGPRRTVINPRCLVKLADCWSATRLMDSLDTLFALKFNAETNFSELVRIPLFCSSNAGLFG